MSVSPDDEIVYKNLHDFGGTLKKGEDTTVADSTDKFFLYALCPQRVFPAGTEVCGIYCRMTDLNSSVGLIHYVTSDGEFILFRTAEKKEEGMGEAQIYLLKVEEFLNIILPAYKQKTITEDGFLKEHALTEKLDKYVFQKIGNVTDKKLMITPYKTKYSDIYDSVKLSDTEKDIINTDKSTIKIHAIDFFSSFGSGRSILNMVSNAAATIYMEDGENGVDYNVFSQLNGGGITSEEAKIEGGERLYRYALHPERVFDQSVTIYNTYCIAYYGYKISGGITPNVERIMGCDGEGLIYFVTSKGDFVLYFPDMPENYDGIIDGDYLIPADHFYNMMVAEREHYNSHSYNSAHVLYRVCTEEDLEPYLFKPIE